MNVKNIPLTQKDVKRAFVPKHDCFLFFDYKAIEVRLLAYYLAVGVGDTSLRDEIQAGLDPHLQTAMGVFGKSEISDEERQAGKTLNFSIIYGGGTPTIMRQLGVDYPKAKQMLRAYHDTRPGIKKLNASISEVLDRRGYIVNSHGRRLHVQESHKALNALIQGSAADLMRESVVKVHHFLEDKTSHIVNIIHDEIMLDAIYNDLATLTYTIPGLMRNEKINEVMQIDVDCEYSETNWADKEAYYEKGLV